MNTRSLLFRQLTLAALVLLSSLNAQAQAPDAFYIYKNDGTVMPFFNDMVDSVKWGNYDLEGNFHRVAVVQEIWTPDSVYRIPLELIDSIGFHKPENKYKADAVRMEQQPWWQYIEEYADSTGLIKLRKDTPDDIVPKVGEKLVTTVQNDIFPGGFMGQVSMRMTDPKTGLKVLYCSRLDFKDVFDEFTASAGFVAQDPTAAAARADSPRKRHIDIDKTIHWPKIDFIGGSYGVQVGRSWDLGGDKSKSLGGGITWGYEPEYDIELWVHYSIETGLEYQYKHRGTVNIKRTYNIQGTGSYHKDQDFGHYKWPIPNCPLLWWYVEPGVFVDASVTASLNWFSQQKYHDYVFVSYKEYEPDLNVYTARTWDETPAESSSASFTLGGSLSAGFYTEIGLRLPPITGLQDNDTKYLMGRIQLGARLEGSAEVDMNEMIVKGFKDASMYRVLNQEVSFALTAFLSGELKAQTPLGGEFFYSIPFEVTSSLGTKFGLVPSFDNVTVSTGKLDSIYYAICNSDVARNLIIPASKMGFTLVNSNGDVVKRVGNRRYWLNEFKNMTDTIRGLEPGVEYSLHPSFDLFTIIPMLGYPKQDFTVADLELKFRPSPIVATRERNVLRLPIQTNARRTGVEVTKGKDWLHAVTDSLTLLVRTDSLRGDTSREGELLLKAYTTDETREIQIDVPVLQTAERMIELEPQSLDFPAEGGTKQVKATLMEPDRKLSVTGQPEWLKTSVSGATISVIASPNPDENRTRTCTLIVLAEDNNGSRAERPLSVTQQCGQPALIVEPKEVVLDGLPVLGESSIFQQLKVSALSTAKKLKIVSESEQDWLFASQLISDAKLEGNYYVGNCSVGTTKINDDMNNERRGTVTFILTLPDNSTVEETVVVRQKPLEVQYKLSPEQVTLLDTRGDDYSDLKEVTVETNLIQAASQLVSSSEITTTEPWLYAVGNWWGPINIYASMNIAPESRTGKVIVRITLSNKEVIERTIDVTQKGTADGAIFTIDPARLEFPGAGGEKTLTIVPQNGAQIDRIWEVNCYTAGDSWLNGSGMNLTAIMYAEPNTTSEWRQRDFAITVLMKDGTKVTQNYVAYQKPAGIDLYPSNSIKFDGMGGFMSMNIESSFEPVTITCDADWLEVERSGNGLFLTAQTNPGDHRSVIVYFTAKDPNGKQISAKLSVSQTSSTGFFRTEPSSFTFEGEGGSKTATIVVGKEIKDQIVGDIGITPSDTWITYKRVNSSGMEVTTTANPTAVEREGTITLTCLLKNGIMLTATQRIIQKAGNAVPEELELLIGTEVEFDKGENYSYKSPWTNCDYITATSNASWLSASVDAEGRVVLYAPENNGAKRTAKVTVTGFKTDAPGATPRTITTTITVTQEGNVQELNFDEYEISAIKVSYYVKCKDTDYRKDGTIKDESFKNYSNEFTLYAEDPDLDYRPLIGNFQATPISGGVHLKVVGTMEDHTANSVEFDLTGIGSDMKGGTINMCNLIVGRYGAYQIPAEFTADNISYNGKDSDWSVWEATEQAGLRISDFECYRLTKPNAANGYNEYCYASDPSNEVRISLKFRKKEKQDNPGGDSKYKINSIEVRSKVSTTLTTYVLNKPTESPYPQETSRTYVLSSPKVSVKGNDLHVEGTDIEGAGHQWNGNISFDIVGGANNLNAGVIKNLNVDSHWKEGTKEEETKYFADGVKFEGMNSGRYDYRTAKNSYHADFIVKDFCYWWSNSTTKEEYKQSDKDSYTIEVLINADEVQQKDYSGAFIGEWHNGSTTLILRSDGTYSKKNGSADAVTGTYELLSYSIDESNQKFSGSIKEPSGKVVSFSGTYTGNILWPSGMTYDGITYRFDDGM